MCIADCLPLVLTVTPVWTPESHIMHRDCIEWNIGQMCERHVNGNGGGGNKHCWQVVMMASL